MHNLTKIFVGVDVSKDHLDIYILHIDKILRMNNTATGFKKLIQELSVYEIECVAFESTGGYERKMEQALQKAGYKTWMLDPARVKAFIRSEGIKAKTDIMDAKMIALFASQKEMKYVSNVLSVNHIELRSLVKRKEALINMMSMEKKRFNLPFQTTLCKELIDDNLKFLKKQKDRVEQEIKTLIINDDSWKHKASIIQSIPGVGEATAAALISHMPDDGKQIAALLGVAPYTQESGQYKGKASIYGGRATPRWPLYMATLTGVRCNPVLKEFYQRLRGAGKSAKGALTAAMRKLICIINVMIRDDAYWKTA